MRIAVRELATIAAATLPAREPLYEFGARRVRGQEALADLRPLFAGRAYIGADMQPGPGVDALLDLHAIALPDASAGAVLCLDTLEHVEHPRRALREMRRILAPGGWALVSSVMQFPIHDHPHDYWRFTPEALRSLLSAFDGVTVESAGDPAFPHTVIGLGFAGDPPDLAAFRHALAAWKRRHRVPRDGPWYRRAAALLAPPLLAPALAAAARARRRRG